MVYVLLADGFEEIEAITPVDVLRRAEIPVKTLGVGGLVIAGSHGIPIVCDDIIENADISEMTGVILPGGLRGAHNLEDSPAVQALIDSAAGSGKLVAAICAAPFVLGHKGLLDGRRATCYPGFEKDMHGATATGENACVDGNFITGKAAGTALDFALAIAEYFKGAGCAGEIRGSLRCR